MSLNYVVEGYFKKLKCRDPSKPHVDVKVRSGSITYCIPVIKEDRHTDFDLSYVIGDGRLTIVSATICNVEDKRESMRSKATDSHYNYRLFDYVYKKILHFAEEETCSELNFAQTGGGLYSGINDDFVNYIVNKYHFSKKE